MQITKLPRMTLMTEVPRSKTPWKTKQSYCGKRFQRHKKTQKVLLVFNLTGRVGACPHSSLVPGVFLGHLLTFSSPAALVIL